MNENKLPRSTPEKQGITSKSILNFIEEIEKEKIELHGFMILRHGNVITEGWWKPYRRELKHMLFSLSKSFTSTAIGLAANEGLFIGLIGLPVFSGFSGGFTKLFGPTGGYLIGFIFMAFISGIFIDKFSSKIYMCFLGMILGTIATYIFGTAWLAYQTHLTFNAALAVGVLPFIPGDIIKMIIASFIGPQIKKRLISSGLH